MPTNDSWLNSYTRLILTILLIFGYIGGVFGAYFQSQQNTKEIQINKTEVRELKEDLSRRVRSIEIIVTDISRFLQPEKKIGEIK